MRVKVIERTKRVVFEKPDVLGMEHLELIRFFHDDAVASIRKNLRPERDVIIEFPLFRYLYDSDEGTLSIHPSKIYGDDVDVVNYKDAFKHLKASKESVRTRSQFKYRNRRVVSKGFKTLTL